MEGCSHHFSPWVCFLLKFSFNSKNLMPIPTTGVLHLNSNQVHQSLCVRIPHWSSRSSAKRNAWINKDAHANVLLCGDLWWEQAMMDRQISQSSRRRLNKVKARRRTSMCINMSWQPRHVSQPCFQSLVRPFSVSLIYSLIPPKIGSVWGPVALFASTYSVMPFV